MFCEIPHRAEPATRKTDERQLLSRAKEKQMRVAIVNLTSGGMSGGYRRYLERLVPLLRADPRITKLDLFLPQQLSGQLDIEPHLVRTWPKEDGWVGYRKLRAQLHLLRPDVVFIPTGRWMNCGPLPTIVMVHNMEPLNYPLRNNPLGERAKMLARRWTAHRACLHSTRIVAVSRYVKDFLVETWKLPVSKIGLVYHGVDKPLCLERVKMPSNFDRSMEDFIFTAGSVRPARGLEDLVKAIACLNKLGLRINLVIAGDAEAGMVSYKQELIGMSKTLGVFSQITWSGHLAPHEMSWCYYHCSAFVMTSRVEACPLIALEALSHRALCISSDNPPMPEIFSNAALYYSTGNSAELSKQIMTAVTGPSEIRRVWQQRAYDRADFFDWSTSARETIGQFVLAGEVNF